MTRTRTVNAWWSFPWIESRSGSAERATVLHIGLLALIVLAAFLVRVHDLAAVGIFQDEKYMALSVRGVLETGFPYLPSGMLYPRALGQIYLMAGSVSLFGDSLWALRFPSVVAGTACVILAYGLARQHMGASLSLAFAATVAFFPDFIEISQMARMYVFLVFAVLAFLMLFTYWLRSGAWSAVAGLFLVVTVAIEFQPLAMLLLPLAIIPPIVAPSVVRASQAVLLMVGGVTVYQGIGAFVDRQYAGTLAAESAIGSRHPAPTEIAGVTQVSHVLVGAAVAVAFLAVTAAIWYAVRHRRESSGIPGDTLAFFLGLFGLGAALVAAALMSYQIAVLVFFAGAAFVIRGGAPWRILLLVVAVATVIALVQSLWILTSGEAEGLKGFARYFLAFPSPGPYMSFVGFFPAAVLVFVLLMGASLWRFARGAPLSYEVLLFTFGVLAPFMAIGLTLWAVAPRYLYGVVPVFLLALFLGVNYYRFLLARLPFSGSAVEAVVAVSLVFLVVSPLGVLTAMDRSYTHYPDHVGAAAFVRELEPQPEDVVVVMDAPIQRYYLDRIDYLLRYIDSAGWQARQVDGTVLDIFTGTPVLYHVDHFEAVLEDDGRGAVYVVGSGEIHGEVAYRFNLGSEIPVLFDTYDAEIIFTGRDQRTHVWKFPAVSDDCCRDYGRGTVPQLSQPSRMPSNEGSTP